MKVAEDLGTSIVTGARAPGSLLPGELELASELGVSRSVVREALRILSAKGLLESKPKTGTRVREREKWNILDPSLLAWMFETVPSAQFVRNLFELRMIVEPAAAELAARKRSARQLSIMGHSLETMAIHTLATAEGQLADQQFHAAILEATDNELIVNLSATIGAAVRWTTFFKYRSLKKPRDPIDEHRQLFQAIADGDADAARQVAIALIRQAEADTETALNAETSGN
ncbi:FadR/GntR family transcriptional regulator [Novosphingopyxis sp.]|uniref:FadR/GntR family transcriptional regulator n=1 Tax=Novosphingopyxis sp. TaxID=2709690 RepID=UPI003B5BBD76